ncbi:MAG TPA: sigma-70 family RNA polymerase sigma factor [Spirochaetota bacterium]|nr:sigma-70 family RNA polymerase sigma factor [Spirochaetota bacterium]HPS85518.1 sigma-70 family RNA polymerase sigma factor [Spirochaetota bacterium]
MNERDFAEIVKRTKKTVLSAIEKNMAPRFYHAIDDVAQETYIRAYNGLIKNSFRGDSSLETWLYKIAKNESLRMNHKLTREEEKAIKARENNSLVQKPDSGDTAYLHDHLMLLPEKYRSVLTLSSQGFNINDISQKLGIRPGTVKSRTSRGKKIIHENIRRENHER